LGPYQVVVSDRALAIADQTQGADYGCEATVSISGTGANGSPVERKYNLAGLLALRGPWLAVASPTAQSIDVFDWQTGAKSYRVTGTLSKPAIDEDGSVLFVAGSGASRQLAYATPGEPSVHPVSIAGANAVQVFSPGGAYAIAAGSGHYSFATPNAVTVFNRSGTVLSAPAPSFFNGPSVDGTRVAWASRPCALVNVTVWDLTTAPPGSSTNCSLPQPSTRGADPVRPGQYSDYGATIPLSCPPTSPQGCAGELTVKAHHHGQAITGSTTFAIAPATSDRVPLGLNQHGRRAFVRPNHRYPALLTMHATNGPTRSTRITLTYLP
jgi:hypothetical protein